MSKRYFRKALVLAVAGVLASPAIASVVNAQTIVNVQSTVTSSGKFVGPVPSGVTGVSVTVTCQNVVLNSSTSPVTLGTQIYTASIPVSGGTGIMNFNLQSTVSGGSSCKVTAAVTGTTNIDKGSIAISVGGTDRAAVSTSGVAATTSVAATATTATTANATRTDGYIPVFLSTDVVVTVSYPQITVKKVVNGDEPTVFAYPMTIGCSNPAASTGTGYVAGFKGNTGSTSTVIGTPDFTGTLPGILADGSVPTAGSLVLPGGAGFYVSFGFTDTTVPGDIRYVNTYDFRTTAVPANTATTFNVLGNVGNNTASLTFSVAVRDAFLAAVARSTVTTPATVLSPIGTVNGVVVFNGTFTLTGAGATNTKSFGINEFPGMTTSTVCEVTETNNQGGVTAYSSSVTNADGTAGTALPGVQDGAVFKSALTKMNQTITVTNSFYGDLIVSKVVTGDPKTNIGTYQISVACDKGGPKDTFLLKDRQSKLYNNISVGTNCLITETLSDGAISSYNDNSGDNTTDGRVTIKARGTGCAQPGSPTGASPGGPSPVTSFNDCMANVIVTNDYNPPVTTTAAPAAPATTAAPAAPATTAAPAVVAEPAQAVEDTPTFTG